MTQEAKHRRQVVYGGKLVPGLYERATSGGRTRFELRKKVGGRVVRHTLASATATDAIREQRKWLAERDAGVRLLRRSDVTLRELRDEWETWARGHGSSYAPRTVEYNLSALDRRALRILGASTKAAAVRPAHLRGMVDRLNAEGFSGSTVHGTLTATSALFRFAVRRDLVAANPVRLLDRGDRPSTKRTKEPNYLGKQQAERLLAELSDDWRPVAACCLYAGLRISEALALRWSDVDFEAWTLWVEGTKTAASAASVPLLGALATELKAHRGRRPGVGDALVFRTATGRPQSRNNAGRAIRAAGSRAGLGGEKRLSPHDLRHSCAGLLLAAGVPVPEVAAIMRHADARVTMTVYAGLAQEQRAGLRGAMEAAFS